MNDYEGIKGPEAFRPDLALLYFATMDPASGTLLRLDMTPMLVRNFRLNRASPLDTEWLAGILNREGKIFGTVLWDAREQTPTPAVLAFSRVIQEPSQHRVYGRNTPIRSNCSNIHSSAARSSPARSGMADVYSFRKR